MKVPTKTERDMPDMDPFTLPTISSSGYASTLEMSDEQKAEARDKQTSKVLGFG
jgi:hypothetical protein